MKKALLYIEGKEKTVHCNCCSHRCIIAAGSWGLCKRRYNDNGELFTDAYEKVIAAAVDPVEKKPLFHFQPGSSIYSIAVAGCNFRCEFCQNWEISQYSKELDCFRQSLPMTAENVVNDALESGCSSIAFTYTEPVIFFEYSLDIAKIAKSHGLSTVFVSNGYMTGELLELASPYLDACNIDLKAFTDHFYKNTCHARLQPVLDSIQKIAALGIHLEITTLLIPGENDSHNEIRGIAEFIASVSKDIPWHVSRFFPRYKFTQHKVTPEKAITDAVAIGYECGLRYVYGGNIGGYSNTECFQCKTTLVKRSGYNILKNAIQDCKCPNCKTEIYGLW